MEKLLNDFFIFQKQILYENQIKKMVLGFYKILIIENWLKSFWNEI
jgi:hypothetical protein